MVLRDKGKVAVDTGGTFTDFIYLDGAGELQAFKTDSTPASPDRAIRRGFEERRLPFSADLLHGTTVATNALLEGKLPPVVMLVTRGYRDILAIGRQNRKRLYDLTPPPRPELIPAARIFEVEERTLADGKVQTAVTAKELERVVRRLRRAKAAAVAVCFLHAYKNPANEIRVKRFLSSRGIERVCTSSEVVCEYREYERFSTTVINALLMPIMGKYLAALEGAFAPPSIHIMQSNGGILSGREAGRLPVRTILSGPAGGVVAVHRLGRALGRRKLIGFDMGGTSTDVSLIDGEIPFASSSEIAGHPVHLSAIDIHTVGAGGGSIARFDRGGILRVGPESVGADPGPAFYGKGREAAVSDANLFCGRLPTDFFRRAIHPERSRQALSRLARAGGMGQMELAAGILRVVNSNMERAIKKISIERGFDPRDFALVSFGGAGGLHSPYLALELEMREVIVPMHAGVFSALGILASDIVVDHSLTVLLRDPEDRRIEPYFQEMIDKARAPFREANRIRGPVLALKSLDVRYLGQSYELNVPMVRGWRREFHARHERMYGSKDEGRPLEVVTLRLKLVSVNRDFKLPSLRPGRGAPRPIRRQKVHWEEGVHATPVFTLSGLFPGHRFSGPALVLCETATTVVPPGFRAAVDGLRNLVITR